MTTIPLTIDPNSQLVTVDDPNPTISVRWDRAVQTAVINDSPGPTIASRAYGLLHTAMFDAWSAYDLAARGTQLNDDLQRPNSENTEANKTEAMSYAAYRVLSELFPGQQSVFDALMGQLGFDTTNTTTDTSTAAGIGNVVAEALMSFRRTDGSNQLNGYVDNTGYTPVNSGSNNITDIAKWTPENVAIDSQQGDADFLRQQSFLTPQWGNVTTFGVSSVPAIRPVAPEPFLLVSGATVNLSARTITLANGSTVNIDASIVGTDPSQGAIINQAFVDQAQQVVDVSANLTDEQKLIAEFWEDGGGTSFPPGTWMTFGHYVSARDDNSLDDDALLFFALGNAVFDAGVTTWEAKTFYDYARPVRAIRELGKLGLLSGGIQGTDELTQETGFVISAWGGPGQGTRTILADNFLTYQTPGSDPSPPFAEYTSGHSAFSAAGAQILQSFTGSDAFGASVSFAQGESRFEPGITPTAANSPLTLAWDTFSAASDEAGLSRIFGGIHFNDGDINGRTLGRNVGTQVWNQAQSFLNGSNVLDYEFTLSSFSNSSEIGFFLVDDAAGSIDGLAPTAAGYEAAAIARSSVIFSALPTTADVVAAWTATSTRSFLEGSFLRFFSISGGTADTFIENGTGTVSLFETQQVQQTTGSFQLTVDGLTVTGAAANTATVGTSLQGTVEAEIIDLTNFTTDVTANITIQREAGFENVVGFYAVDDLTGLVTDSSGNQIAAAATDAYIQAALARRLTNINLTVANNSSSTISTTLAAGQILAPFIVSNGTIEQLLDTDLGNNPNIFFPFLNANSDGVDHFRIFGNNVFGIEDLVNGGDQDFDDLIVSVEFA